MCVCDFLILALATDFDASGVTGGTAMASPESEPTPTPEPEPEPEREHVRILHLSDTHGLHETIEARFPLPEADILVHTGDFTDHGTRAEIASFNEWLGTLRPRHVPSSPHIHIETSA